MENNISQQVFKVLQEILGVDSSWKIIDAECSLEDKKIFIRMESTANQTCCCPICKFKYDPIIKKEELQFRYFPMLGFQTYLYLPDIWIHCNHHGMQKIVSPWEKSIQNSFFNPSESKAILRVI